MNIYVTPPFGMSVAMDRVAYAFEKHAPSSIRVVPKEQLADFVLLHVIDYNGVPEVIERLRLRGQQYGIMQYCIRSAQRPNTGDWTEIWKNVPVWSYYDLERLCREDGTDTSGMRFYHAPLGCDSRTFFPKRDASKYLVTTSGYVAESECADAVSNAVRSFSADARQFHLGPPLELGPHVEYRLHISDEELSRQYGASDFVAGLRRCEGFELPLVEGFFCGARPITFDAPHYRDWYGEMAEFVSEGASEDVAAEVLEIFRRGVRPVTAKEIERVKPIFNWKTLVTNYLEFAL